MIRWLAPRAVAASVPAIDPATLRALGIRGLIVDLDNTLVPFGRADVSPQVRAWLDRLAAAGIAAAVASNGPPARVAALSATLALPAVRGLKPAAGPFRRALSLLRTRPEETAVVGDQVFTDILGGNVLGLYTILVEPLSGRDFLGTRVARAVERWLRPRLVRSARQL